jgi:hypothetical protein
MVSWNDEDDMIEGNDSVGVVKSKFGKKAKNLFLFAKLGAWDDLVQNLHACSSKIIRDSLDELAGDEGATLLHVVLSNCKVPVAVVETILEFAGGPPSMATIQNSMQQTPLHTAIFFIPDKTEIVECLVRVAPEIARQRDCMHLRPIDILTQKVIMTEEVIKYSHQYGEKILDDLWETAHVLAHANSLWQDQTLERQPIVHTCLKSFDFPFALKERALKRYETQLRQTDGGGNLPLHVIARQYPPHKGEEEEDDELDFFNRVLSLYPGGASQLNDEHETPFFIAIRSGRRWNSGLLRLLEAHPAAIDDLQLPRGIYPLLFARLVKAEEMSILYDVINALPQLCSQSF